MSLLPGMPYKGTWLNSQHTNQFIRIVFLLGICLVSFEAIAQQLSSPRYIVESLGNKQGLNSSDVSALYQDKDGFIWVGTQPGVSKLDSYDVQNFTKVGERYLGQIHSITEDKAGTLWIGGVNGLFFYQDGQFHATQFEQYGIRALHVSQANELWIGGSNFVPFVLTDSELEKIKKGQEVIHHPIVSQEEWESQMNSFWVWHIDTDDQGKVWLALDNQRASFDGTDLQLHYTDRVSTHGTNVVVAINADSIYWGAEHIGAMFQKGEQVHKVTDPSTYIMAGTDSSIYFLTAMDLLERNNGQWDTLHTFSTYAHLYFKEMILDREGNFWIGAEGDLLKLTPTPFKTWSVADDPLLHANHSIAQLPNNEILIGSSKKHILKVKGDGFAPYVSIDAPHNSWTGAIYADKRGWIWYGTSMGGIIVDRNGVQQTYQVKDGLADKGQYLFYEDSHGELWSGGEHAITRVKVDDQGEITFENFIADFEGDAFPLFQDIVESPDGTIWAVGDKGLFTIKGKELTRWAFPSPATPYPIITGSAVDANDQLWLSTQGEGLWQCRFDEKNEPILIHQWSAKDGLLSDVVLNVHVDEKDQVWAVSQSGICCLADPSNEWLIRCYDESDGWLNQPSSDIQLLESTDSMLWAMGTTAITTFPLYRLPVNPVAPNSFITQVQLFEGKEDIYRFAENQEGEGGLPENLCLPFDKNFLRFYFTTTSHTKEKKNKFRFILEGLDPDWNEGSQTRNILYPGLQAGTYTFKVQAANNDGIWEQKVTTFSFTILSPWYQTWWAYTLMFLALSAISYYVYRFRLDRKLQQQETFRLKELDRFKTRFYSNITHEFRTPLTVIQGMTNELAKDLPDQSQKKLDLIRKNSRNLLDLVNQVLDLSKLRAGKLEPALAQSDIIVFLKYLVDAHESLAGLKQINLQFQSKQPSLIMDFDPKQLQLVFTNLISNAIKFTPEEGKVWVAVNQIDEVDPPLLDIQVRDNGIGISAGDIPLIFDRFHQARRMQESQGSGIGLALVKELVEFMKGSIRVESELGKGSTFFLSFPIHHNAPLVTDSTQDHFHIKTTPEIRIQAPGEVTKDGLPVLLIIEDSVDVTYYLQVCLEDQYQIVTCANGQEGVERAYELIPDVIISDVMMPKMDGFEVCKRIKTDVRTNHIPIILLTARATMEDKLLGLDQGADAYLIKPFEKAELLLRLNKLMEIRQTLQKKYSSSLLNSQSSPKGRQTPVDEFMKKIEDAIIQGLQNENFSVNELAAVVHLSRSHVHRKIKVLTGMSTAIYIRKVRLQKAKELLEATNFSISEIAYQVGFKSPVYFSQVFKETFGDSPRKLRKMSEKDNIQK